MNGVVSAGKHFGNAAGEAFHQCERGVGAEAIALVSVEGIDGSDQREIAVADQFHQGQAGPQMFAGDADDQTKIGLDDAVFRVGDRGGGFLPAGGGRATRANCGSILRRAVTNWNLWKFSCRNKARSRPRVSSGVRYKSCK